MKGNVCGTKRDSSQDLLLVQSEDDVNKLIGSTRLVSLKTQSPSSLRGSRSPVSSPQNPFHTPKSPPPVTVTPASANVSPLYEEPMQMQNYPMEAISSYYQQSPGMTLFRQPQIQNHWQPTPALQIGNQAISMQADNSQESMVGDQMMMLSNTGIQIGQYGLGSGYDYMNNDGSYSDGSYSAQQMCTTTTQELMSPQNIDPEGAWGSLYMQFGV